jgi:hypothetical protein
MICKTCGENKPLFSFQKIRSSRGLKKTRVWVTYENRRKDCNECVAESHRVRRAEKKKEPVNN